MKWMTNTSRKIVVTMLLQCILVITVTVYYVISVITFETQNTKEAHGPHHSPEKTVLTNMKAGQYVFAIS